MIALDIEKRPTPRTQVDVLHVIPYMHPRGGGPPVVVDRLCRMLEPRGWTNRVITTNAFANTNDNHWAKCCLGDYPLEIFPCSRLGNYSHSTALAAHIDELVAQSRLVHLHTLWTHPTLVAMRACHRHHVPYVVMPHGMLDPNSLVRKWLKKQLYGRLVEWPNIRRASSMVYTTTEEKSLAESAVARLPNGRIVPLGADDPPDVPRPVLAEEFLAAHPELRGKSLVIFLSRLHSKKGLDLLIPGFELLSHRMPDAHLLLVGPGEQNYVTKLRSIVREAGISDRVSLIGSLEGRAKWAALAASRVFVLPSYQENFALVVVEALRMGVPVVVSRRINIWEQVVSSGGGAACELTPHSISETLLPWASDASQAEKAGQLGQGLVLRNYSWARSADAMSRIYGEILGRNVRLGSEWIDMRDSLAQS